MARFSGRKADLTPACHIPSGLHHVRLNMTQVTQERVRELFDYRDGNLFWKIRSARCIKIGDMAGWENGNAYKKVRVDGKIEYVHRVVFLYHHGHLPTYVDHKDLNPANNRIENLREATRNDNARNKSKQKNNTTGYIGVSFRKDSNKFRAMIAVNSKSIRLGSYLTAYEAALAYNEAAKRFHGKFASLNKMPQTA
jgi:hypothetical protein